MIVVLGAFDGFHKGHALLFERARTLAELHSSASAFEDWAVVTFSPHPDSVLKKSSVFLFTEEERTGVARFFNVPHVVKIPFDEALSQTPPEAFIELLETFLPLTGIVVGSDFRFGRKRMGDASFLREMALHKKWIFEMVDTLVVDGAKVGSSDIKQSVATGDVLHAKALLGYPFFFRGNVVAGDGRGRAIGFPTANIDYPEEKIVPERGVYAASVLVGGEWRPGALNIGYNPTFVESSRKIRFETFVLDLDESLYGRTLTVFLESYLRPEAKFDSVQALIRQMELDISIVRACFRECHTGHKEAYDRLARVFSCFDSVAT